MLRDATPWKIFSVNNATFLDIQIPPCGNYTQYHLDCASYSRLFIDNQSSRCDQPKRNDAADNPSSNQHTWFITHREKPPKQWYSHSYNRTKKYKNSHTRQDIKNPGSPHSYHSLSVYYSLLLWKLQRNYAGNSARPAGISDDEWQLLQAARREKAQTLGTSGSISSEEKGDSQDGDM